MFITYILNTHYDLYFQCMYDNFNIPDVNISHIQRTFITTLIDVFISIVMNETSLKTRKINRCRLY